jgi:hypothetical protein
MGEEYKMQEKGLLRLRGIAFFLLTASSLISLKLGDYSIWAISLVLALMVLSAGSFTDLL